MNFDLAEKGPPSPFNTAHTAPVLQLIHVTRFQPVGGSQFDPLTVNSQLSCTFGLRLLPPSRPSAFQSSVASSHFWRNDEVSKNLKECLATASHRYWSSTSSAEHFAHAAKTQSHPSSAPSRPTPVSTPHGTRETMTVRGGTPWTQAGPVHWGHQLMKSLEWEFLRLKEIHFQKFPSFQSTQSTKDPSKRGRLLENTMNVQLLPALSCS